jgi:LAS superfamily LD-carboxypeptidase LdcB
MFQIKNQVRKPRVGHYYLAAIGLALVVVLMVVIGSALPGAAGGADLPRGAGPVADNPAEATQVQARPAAPYVNEPWFADPDGLLLVVDRKAALARNFEPADLVKLAAQGVPCQPDTWKARRVILKDLNSLFLEGRQAGFDYFVFSAYRSYNVQAGLYEYWVKQLGKKEADRSSARAGHSEHQLGTTLDISAAGIKGNVFDVFGTTDAGRWLAAHAWRFGFVMSYPLGEETESGYMYEPWHFRYVGREVAAIIHDNNLVSPVFIRELGELRAERDSLR